MNMIIKPKRKSRLQCVREIRAKALKIVSAAVLRGETVVWGDNQNGG